ncbi:hypothetical protein MPH_05344 [Macrophomina phaseolina MS6]|uniref:Uncharacterized protein n=2 Tax=Macrophomina phaseolina TaxID=35725 RepID=K2RRS6_MACPH|nr:hypothetical protein MPH_05344 [Macrophomina phaseolina MS6]KAH7047364.1 hypothetical protein B0J12DRAFT_741290 [Macrophomina phaseolina]
MPEAPITPGSPGRSNEDTPMDDAPPAEPTRPVGEVPYNKDFEDSVMRAVLNPPPTDDGLESRGPLPAFLLGRDTVPHEELPLPLDDPRRQFKSAVPGIKLTHPTGAYEGGNPAVTDEERAWRREFVQQHGVRTAEELERAKAQAVQELREELRRTARARKEALEEREKVEKELKNLNDQREIEIKALNNLVERAKAKKEERRARRNKLAVTVDGVS